MKLTQQNIIIIVLLVVLFGVVVFASAKGAFRTRRPELEIRDGDGGVITNDEGEIDDAVYRNKAEAIYRALNAWNFSDEGMLQVYNIISRATNNELRLIVNAYEKQFGNDEYYPTIRALLEGEYLACGNWYYFGYESTACQQRRECLERLTEIGA